MSKDNKKIKLALLLAAKNVCLYTENKSGVKIVEMFLKSNELIDKEENFNNLDERFVNLFKGKTNKEDIEYIVELFDLYVKKTYTPGSNDELYTVAEQMKLGEKNLKFDKKINDEMYILVLSFYNSDTKPFHELLLQYAVSSPNTITYIEKLPFIMKFFSIFNVNLPKNENTGNNNYDGSEKSVFDYISLKKSNDKNVVNDDKSGTLKEITDFKKTVSELETDNMDNLISIGVKAILIGSESIINDVKKNIKTDKTGQSDLSNLISKLVCVTSTIRTVIEENSDIKNMVDDSINSITGITKRKNEESSPKTNESILSENLSDMGGMEDMEGVWDTNVLSKSNLNEKVTQNSLVEYHGPAKLSSFIHPESIKRDHQPLSSSNNRLSEKSIKNKERLDKYNKLINKYSQKK